MKKSLKFLILISIFLMVAMPMLSLALEPLVQDCGTNCGFQDFMKLINRVIGFIFKYLALPIAAIMFAYAGVLLVTSAGSTEARGRAKHIFWDAVVGLVMAAAAWVIVKTLLSILGYKDIGLFF